MTQFANSAECHPSKPQDKAKEKMTLKGVNDIKWLERATEIQRLFQQSEELRRKFAASPGGVKGAKMMGEALKLDAEIKRLVDEQRKEEQAALKIAQNASESVQERFYLNNEAEIWENDLNEPSVIKSEFESISENIEIQEQSIFVPTIIEETPASFDFWITDHLDIRNRIEGNKGIPSDANENCELGEWLKNQYPALQELTARHQAFHQAVFERFETEKINTNLHRTLNALVIALTREKEFRKNG